MAAPPDRDGPDGADDPFLWLEEVEGERALAWVRARNAESTAVLEARPEYEPIRTRLLAQLDAKERIPQVARRGDFFYNLWQDEAQPRGLWRRTTLAEYRKSEPAWETVLDLDALAAAEGENWVWGGAAGLEPDHDRCLVQLSRGGADAVVVREFDTVAKRFVEGGFVLPEAKSEVDWLDRDTLLVGTDLGPGSLTRSGYARVLKRWRRGTPLASAETVFEVDEDDMAASAEVDRTPGHARIVFVRLVDFYAREYFLERASERQRLDVPDDAEIAFWHSAGDPRDTLLIELRSDWTIGGAAHPGGALLAIDAAAFLAGARDFEALFVPSPTRSLAGWSATRRHLILEVLDNVGGRLEEIRRDTAGYTRRVIDAPYPGTLSTQALHDPMQADDPYAETYLLGYSDFLTPDTLWLAEAGGGARELLKALPARFEAAGLRVAQHVARSVDGTDVPYFVIGKPPSGAAAGAASTPAPALTREPALAAKVTGPNPGDRRNASEDAPTLLYGYGGFEVPMLPSYHAPWGAAWLERGGTLAIANIRGGGEFGPAWHQAAIREHKQRSYDDFIAVAEDLIARGITTPEQLGIEGGSNGGLLVGAVAMQRPDLFGAVVCSVPLLDMRRYHRLLAGASWMAEYGDPDDPEDWAFIAKYSPYQNVRPGIRYPEILFTTSTRDDRVHPGHARKMAAKLLAHGQRVLYFENIEGGHGGAADNAQRARMQALELTYLWRQLGG